MWSFVFLLVSEALHFLQAALGMGVQLRGSGQQVALGIGCAAEAPGQQSSIGMGVQLGVQVIRML